MPPTFDFGSVFAPGIQIEIYMPAVFDVLREWGNTMAAIGRLQPGMRLEAAQTEAKEVIDRQQQDRPEFGSNYNAILKPFHESVIGDAGRSILTLWTGVGLVLLIVCVNLSSLLLARAATRRKEIALRAAIGAGRGRLARQLLTESLVLSALGGGLGVAFAYAAVDYVRRVENLSIPLLKTVTIDTGALGIALGVTVLTALLFGLAPAIAAVRGNLDDALRGGGRGSSEGRDHRFVRSILVVSEVGLACLLLIGAGLMMRSFLHVLDVDLGFGTERTYTLRVDAGENTDSMEKFSAYMRQIVSTARAVPGIAAASITDAVPLDSNRTWGVRAKEQPPDQYHGALVKMVGPGLMETMGTPIIAGREFTEFDDDQSVPVALINQSLAEILWPGKDPLSGILMNSGKELQVVGVVADVRHLSVEGASVPEFYLSVLQQETMSPSLVVRTDRPFADVAPGLRVAFADLVPDLPTTTFVPLQQVVDRALSPRRFIVNLLVAFAAAAIVLAAIGIYGVISYSVARRAAEIGIRKALGASRARIRAGIVGHTLLLAISGIAIGGVSAVAFSSLLASLLFGVSPRDPWSFVGAGTVLLLVAVAAGFIPAFRASRISPMAALRAE
jgi:predicted permease